MSLYRTILICTGILTAAGCIQAQSWQKACGPVRGHWSDSLRCYWFLCKNHKEDNTKEIDSYIRNQSKQATEIQIDTIKLNKKYIALQYRLRGDFAVEKADSFSFLVGSCAMPFPILFWSGKKREVIFDRMREQKTDFMVWTGDNVYYLFGEWNKRERMARVNIAARTSNKLQQLLENQPNYATWDDHDYGPNNSGKNNPDKDKALAIFKDFWMNPSYGEPDNPGTYTRWTWQNAEFFLLDTRSYCEKDNILGDRQMQWLKKGLQQSTAQYKFVISPTQILSPPNVNEGWDDYEKQRKDFLQFIENTRISGLFFISGDLHYAEWNSLTLGNGYKLNEFCTSPMTSFSNPTYPKEHPLRDEGTLYLKQNFGKVTVNKDCCRFDLFDRAGKILWSKTLYIKDYSF